jgi:hypothetical protein
MQLYVRSVLPWVTLGATAIQNAGLSHRLLWVRFWFSVHKRAFEQSLVLLEATLARCVDQHNTELALLRLHGPPQLMWHSAKLMYSTVSLTRFTVEDSNNMGPSCVPQEPPRGSQRFDGSTMSSSIHTVKLESRIRALEAQVLHLQGDKDRLRSKVEQLQQVRCSPVLHTATACRLGFPDMDSSQLCERLSLCMCSSRAFASSFQVPCSFHVNSTPYNSAHTAV